MRSRIQQDSVKIKFKDRLKALQNIPFFFRDVYQTSPSLTIYNIAIRLLRAILPVLMLYFGKLVIDEVVFLSANKEKEMKHLWYLVAIELGLVILNDILGKLAAYTDTLLGNLYTNRTSIKLMEHAASLDLEQFEDTSFYDKLERARVQVSGRTDLLSQILAQGQDAITMLGLIVGLFSFNPWLILLLIFAVIPTFIGEVYFNTQNYLLQRKWTPQRRLMDYYRYIGASDDTAKEIKLFSLSDFLINRFREISTSYYQESKKIALKRVFWGAFLGITGTLGYFFAYGVIIFDTVKGIVSLGSLTFLTASFRQVQNLLASVLARFNIISQGALYLNDLFDFYKIKPTVISPSKPRPIPNPIKEGFVFENVGFQYTNSNKWANRHLNFELKVGEKLALVGENGSGKTTLVKLLSRLYDPTEGRILLDGYDLKEYDLKELRAQIGVIFQDFQRFQFTANDNIAVGDIMIRDNVEEITRAAKQSLADGVIEKLPLKYQQPLGRRFFNGVELSGGEWQKVALARAYLREANVIILDEPTAALDARSEFEVFKRFTELTKGKTAVLISHRFSTVRMADRILVLDKGQMLEMGSHEELLAKKSRYAELFHLQAEGYK